MVRKSWENSQINGREKKGFRRRECCKVKFHLNRIWSKKKEGQSLVFLVERTFPPVHTLVWFMWSFFLFKEITHKLLLFNVNFLKRGLTSWAILCCEFRLMSAKLFAIYWCQKLYWKREANCGKKWVGRNNFRLKNLKYHLAHVQFKHGFINHKVFEWTSLLWE